MKKITNILACIVVLFVSYITSGFAEAQETIQIDHTFQQIIKNPDGSLTILKEGQLSPTNDLSGSSTEEQPVADSLKNPIVDYYEELKQGKVVKTLPPPLPQSTSGDQTGQEQTTSSPQHKKETDLPTYGISDAYVDPNYVPKTQTTEPMPAVKTPTVNQYGISDAYADPNYKPPVKPDHSPIDSSGVSRLSNTAPVAEETSRTLEPSTDTEPGTAPATNRIAPQSSPTGDNLYYGISETYIDPNYKPPVPSATTPVISTSSYTYIEPAHVPTYSDVEHRHNFQAIGSDIPLTYNSYVQAFINVYVRKKRSLSERVLGLKNVYFPIFEDALARHGLPDELKYLAVTESALNTHAVSRAGATGLWQFMRATGKENGLRIDSYIDERRDPYEATEAAARFLSRLYNKYGNWLLVIAAYNCGPGKVNSAIRRSGSRDFWTLRKYLPRETRGYVPAFISCVYWMNYSENYLLNTEPPIFPNAHQLSDTVRIHQKIHFKAIAKHTNVSMPLLRYLNPAYRKDMIPASTQRSRLLRLPVDAIWDFETQKDSILLTMQDPEMQKLMTAATHVRASASYRGSGVKPKGKEELIYTVKSGDNLGFIAERYGCRVSDLKRWNGIGTRIRIGQKLKIYVNPKNKSKYATAKDNLKSSGSDYRTSSEHKVQKGDTLWGIARKYPGVSVENLMKLNNLSKSSKLQPGMVLKLKG